MKTRNTILICLLILTFCISCRLVDSLTKNESAGTIKNLWSDVPPLDGATKAEMSVPLGVRLMIRAMTQGKVNFITYKTNKSAREVKDFYSVERMKNAGWKADENNCFGDTEEKEIQGATCFYTRQDGKNKEGLAIILAEDAKTKETDVFYARIDTTDEKASEENKK